MGYTESMRNNKTTTILKTEADNTQRALMNASASGDLEARRLYLMGEVTDEMAARFIISLDVLNQRKGQIVVVICSPGGSVPAGFAMFDAMRLSPNEIVTLGTGEVHSIATLIMQGGKTRLLTPHTRMMVHNISVGLDTVLNNDQLHVTTKEISALSQMYAETMAGATKQTVEAIRHMCRKETYMSAMEAVEGGFVDGIIHGSHFEGDKPRSKNPQKSPAKKATKKKAKK